MLVGAFMYLNEWLKSAISHRHAYEDKPIHTLTAPLQMSKLVGIHKQMAAGN